MLLLLDRQSRQILNNANNDDVIISFGIPGEDDPQLQEIILKHSIHAPCGDINPDVVSVKQTDRPSTGRRNNSSGNISSTTININRNRNNPINIVDDVVKVLFLLAGCPGLCIELHNVSKCCVVCRRNVHRLCMNEFSDI